MEKRDASTAPTVLDQNPDIILSFQHSGIMELSPAQRAILDTLAQVEGPQTLKDIAAATDRSPPATHRNLGILADHGLVLREGRFHDAAFRLAPHVQVLSSDMRPSPTGKRRPVLLEWSTTGAVDWRFPLVSRIPDRPAREMLAAFFSEATIRELLTPWTLYPTLDTSDLLDEHPDRSRFLKIWGEASTHAQTTLVVYGSCARGDARSGSDLDLAIIVDDDADSWIARVYERLFTDLVWDTDATDTRPLSILVRTWKQIQGGKRQVDKSIVQEGLTVYAMTPDAPWIETLRGA